MSRTPASSPSRLVKPRLRGVSHEIAFFVSLLAGGLLVSAAPSDTARLAAGIYAASLAALFGISALYHRPQWAPAPRARLKRLDHAAIFVLVAGTYTPICLLALEEKGPTLLAIVWSGAALGVLQAAFWVQAPRWVSAALYVALGWVVVAALPSLVEAVGGFGLAGLVGGGVLYTLGAAVYASRRPDPAPRIFGYHEVFHALVVAAGALHFAVVRQLVLGA